MSIHLFIGLQVASPGWESFVQSVNQPKTERQQILAEADKSQEEDDEEGSHHRGSGEER